MRSFIALEIPERFRFETAGLARALASTIEGRFIDPQGYHITLAFLGDADEPGLAAAMAAVDALANSGPIGLTSSGLGKFGNGRDATLWLGLTPSAALDAAARRVREELSARGVPFDAKAFVPHITLTRRAKLAGGELGPLPFPNDDEARLVTLFKSRLEPDGAVYVPLHTVALDDEPLS